jgi:hypothetical protein
MQNKRQIKNFLINPAFQFKFALIPAISSIIAVIIAIFICTFYLKNAYFQFMNASTDYSPELVNYFTDQLNTTILILTISLTSLIIIIVFMGIYLTHKVAGPIYKMEKHIEKILREKSLEPLYFREGDEFQDLALKFNDLIKNVNLTGEK